MYSNLPNTKSRGLAALLTILFPPFGLLYSTVKGFLIMLFAVPVLIVLLCSICILMGQKELAVFIIIAGMVTYVPICFFWSINAVNHYNKKKINIWLRSNMSSEESDSTYFNNYFKTNKENNNIAWNILGVALLILLLILFLSKREVIRNSLNSKYQNVITSVLQFTISGKYYCANECIYSTFEFKGKSTVIIQDVFVSSYVIDGNYIRIKTDKSDLLLRIQDENTLLGEGFATGIFRKNLKISNSNLINSNANVNEINVVNSDQLLVDLNDNKLNGYKVTGISYDSNYNYQALKDNTHFIFGSKKIYLIKDKKPVKIWDIVSSSFENEEEVLTTSQGDTFFIFYDISISDKNKKTTNYTGENVDVGKIDILKSYLK